MLSGIDHVAIKVKRIESVRNAYELAGYRCVSIQRYEEVGMDIGFFECGNSRIELLEVYSDQSPAASSPLGIHHIGLKTERLEETFRMMEREDAYVLEGQIRQGAHARIFFYRLKKEPETLYECVESKP